MSVSSQQPVWWQPASLVSQKLKQLGLPLSRVRHADMQVLNQLWHDLVVSMRELPGSIGSATAGAAESIAATAKTGNNLAMTGSFAPCKT
jgi:hypothetical protein